MSTTVALPIIVLLIASCICYGIWRYVSRLSRLEALASTVSFHSSRLDEFRNRAQLVEPAAVEYVNSLGKEGMDLLEELQRRVESTAYLLEQLEELVMLGDSDSLHEVELFLSNEHPRQQRLERGFDGSVRDLQFSPDWDREVERILQRLGRSVSQASIAATSIGVPKSRRRKSTLMNLLEAGIDLVQFEKEEGESDEENGA